MQSSMFSATQDTDSDTDSSGTGTQSDSDSDLASNPSLTSDSDSEQDPGSDSDSDSASASDSGSEQDSGSDSDSDSGSEQDSGSDSASAPASASVPALESNLDTGAMQSATGGERAELIERVLAGSGTMTRPTAEALETSVLRDILSQQAEKLQRMLTPALFGTEDMEDPSSTGVSTEENIRELEKLGYNTVFQSHFYTPDAETGGRVISEVEQDVDLLLELENKMEQEQEECKVDEEEFLGMVMDIKDLKDQEERTLFENIVQQCQAGSCIRFVTLSGESVSNKIDSITTPPLRDTSTPPGDDKEKNTISDAERLGIEVLSSDSNNGSMDMSALLQISALLPKVMSASEKKAEFIPVHLMRIFYLMEKLRPEIQTDTNDAKSEAIGKETVLAINRYRRYIKELIKDSVDEQQHKYMNQLKLSTRTLVRLSMNFGTNVDDPETTMPILWYFKSLFYPS